MKSQARLSVRSINQSNRSISVRLSFLFCSRAFISRSYENRSIVRSHARSTRERRREIEEQGKKESACECLQQFLISFISFSETEGNHSKGFLKFSFLFFEETDFPPTYSLGYEINTF